MRLPDTNNTTQASGLYVHVPFCRGKCPYCDFYSVTDFGLIDDWLRAVASELAGYRDDLPVFDSLYLGGGTPSLLDESRLGRLLDSLRREVNFAPDCEITLEANPDDVTPTCLRSYRNLGINRLSLGVQSFNDKELRFLGRRHTARQSQQAIQMARDAGFTNLSLDLICALPGQTLAGWERNLEAALAFRPEHLSCYQLTVEPGTQLASRSGGRVKAFLSEEAEREIFLFTSAYLQGEGYLHYEISNFARGEHRMCRHNLKYWQRRPYLGLGPAAHSFDGLRRWWNHRSLDAYCQALAQGVLPVAGREILTADQVKMETLLLGFRTREGVPASLIEDVPGREDIVGAMLAEGLVKMRDGRLMPTPLGLVVADRLPLLFIFDH